MLVRSINAENGIRGIQLMKQMTGISVRIHATIGIVDQAFAPVNTENNKKTIAPPQLFL
jgi:hypothetical protein